jgi:hypothetical protein
MLGIRASFLVCLVSVGLTGAMAATPAHAQVDAGVQAGLSLDPDQFFFGGHIETAPLVDRLRFRPGLDVGIGDGGTAVTGNFDFTYTFPNGGPWGLYVGAGPSINFYDADDFDSATDGGFNFLIGARQARGLFFEARIGVAGSPDFKFGIGYTFR